MPLRTHVSQSKRWQKEIYFGWISWFKFNGFCELSSGPIEKLHVTFDATREVLISLQRGVTPKGIEQFYCHVEKQSNRDESITKAQPGILQTSTPSKNPNHTLQPKVP